MSEYKKEFIEVVGKEIYGSWISMLNALAPDGRTDCISVLVAGFLHYALEIGLDKKLDKNPVVKIIDGATQDPCPDKEIKSLIGSLFEEAGVSYIRKANRGDRYSIDQATFEDFYCWHDKYALG